MVGTFFMIGYLKSPIAGTSNYVIANRMLLK